MARYNYNVNTAAKYIDVHKQFNGGLKTVDTDDALGAVYLRDAENVSLSEFGFIEKRYGTYENFRETNSNMDINSFLQGYWEFQGIPIYALDGKLYASEGIAVPLFDTLDGANYEAGNVIDGKGYIANDIIDGLRSTTDPNVGYLYEFSYTGISPNIEKEDDTYRYPSDSLLTEWQQSFQTTRDMNAVNINDVLYIFTGTYPIYVKKINGELRFYWLPIWTPTYDEIVVTGHNLLESEYEDLYYGDNQTLNTSVVPGSPAISRGEITPMFGAEHGEVMINMYFKPTLAEEALKIFSYSSPTVNSFYELMLE